MISLWCDTSDVPRFPKLEGEKKTEVLIIGGGICGVLLARRLEDAGVDYVLAEAERIGGGTTGGSTAKITSQHGLIYKKLTDRYGYARAREYLAANETAIREYAEFSADCDMETKNSYIYSTDDEQRLIDEVHAAERLGINARYVKAKELPLPFKTKGAVMFPNQAQFNPLKFIAEISRGLKIFENTRIIRLTPKSAEYAGGSVRADKIAVTTHFPIYNRYGAYFLKLYQHRSYVCAFENAPDVDGMYMDEDKKGFSLRNYGKMLLIGGGAHRTGKKGGGWREIREFSAKYYPNASERFHWAAQDCMSLDGIPYIGRYSKSAGNMFVATGFNKWGITSAMAASKILADMICGKKPEYAQVFAPDRAMYIPQLIVNGFESIVNLITPAAPRCTHLGCALKWNPDERTWDCPCHGSRFTDGGNIIDAPATKGLKNR